MKTTMLYFVIIATLLVVVALMSGVGQVLGQQKETPTEPSFYWTPDPNNSCPSCVQLVCDEDNVWCSTVTPAPPVTSVPYPNPDMIYIVETVIEPYPAPVDIYSAPIVEDDSSNNVDKVKEYYVSTSIPIVMSTPTPTCSHLQLHSICNKRR